MKSTVKADLPARSASLVMYFFQLSLGLLMPHTSGQDPTWHPTVQFPFYRGIVLQDLHFCGVFFLRQGLRQSPSHYSSWNLSFNISTIDSFLLPTSILVLSLQKLFVSLVLLVHLQTDFHSLKHVLSRRLKTFPPSFGPLLYKGLGWVLLGRSSPWLSKPPGLNHPLPLNV